MVSLAKKRIDPLAAANGTWIRDIPGWAGLEVFITALDTDACVKERQRLCNILFGDEDAEIDDPALKDYVNINVILNAALKDMRGLTDDIGKPINYSPQLIRMQTLKPQAGDAPIKTPDGLEFDAAAKPIRDMLMWCGNRAGKVREGAEKKRSSAGSAGAEVSAPAPAISTSAPPTETATPTSSSPESSAKEEKGKKAKQERG
jgi:hypothetical protein